MKMSLLFLVRERTYLQMEIYVTLTERNVCPAFRQKGEGKELIVFSSKQSFYQSGIFWSGVL